MAERVGSDTEQSDTPPTDREGVVRIHQPQKRLSSEETAQLAVVYRQGSTIRQLARDQHMSREAVRTALSRARVQTRKSTLRGAQLNEARELRLQGWSLNQLGKKFGVDPKTIKKRLAALDAEREY